MTDTDQGNQVARAIRDSQPGNLGGQLVSANPVEGPPQNPYQIGGRNPWQMAVDLIRPPQGQPGIFSGERQDPTNTTPQNYIPAQRRSDHTMWGKDDAVLEGARRYPGVTPGPFMPYGQAQLAQVFHESAAGLANIGSGAVGPLGMQSAAYQTAFIKARMQKQEWEARMNQVRMREAAQKLEDEQRKESLAYGEIFAEYGDDKDKLKTALREHAMEKVGGLDQPIITALENGGTDAAKRVLQERDYYYLGLAKTNQQREDMEKQRLELEKRRTDMEQQKLDEEKRAREAQDAARARWGIPTPGATTTPPAATPPSITPPVPTATPPVPGSTTAAAEPTATPTATAGQPRSLIDDVVSRRLRDQAGGGPKDPMFESEAGLREAEKDRQIDDAIRNNPDPKSRLDAIRKFDPEAAQYYQDIGEYRVGARQRAGGKPSRGQDVAERIYGGHFDSATMQLVQGYNSVNGQEFQSLSNSRFLAEEQRQVLLAVKALRDSGVPLDRTFGNSIDAMKNMAGGPNAALWSNLYQTLSNYAETVTRVNRGVGGAEADIRRQIDLGMQEFMGLPIGSLRGVTEKVLIDSATAHSKVEGYNDIFKHATGRETDAPGFDPNVAKTFDALKRVDRKAMKFKGDVPDMFKDEDGNPLIYPEAGKGATSGDLARPKTPAEAQSLAPGTRYLTPDGRTMVR